MAAPPTRPALRARYDRRRAEVVAEAARVFAQRGYAGTTMQALADEAGIATGGLYHYVGAKEQLLVAICDELMEPLLAAARDQLAAADGRDPDERLRDLVRLWVGHVVAHRDHMLVFQQERHTIERDARWRGVRASRKAFERLVEDALHDARADVAVADRRLALSALLGMVNHTAQWFRPRGRLTPDEVADGYLALLLR